jgi:membrane associated rhomboid family serine protease
VIPLHDDNPTRSRAYVTILLIIVNIGIYFLIQAPKSPDAETAFEYRWAGVPCEIHTGKPVVAVPEDAPVAPDSCVVPATNLSVPETPFPQKNVWAALFFSMFLHASILHVLGNMLFLWIFGNNVEDQLGHWWYLALYLVGGVVASLVHVAGNLNSPDPFLGASGAIAVLLGAYFVWFPRARVLTLIVVFPVWLPAFVVLGLWFVLQFGTQSSSGIATLAHIGGFVFGAFVAFVLHTVAGFPRVRARSPGT